MPIRNINHSSLIEIDGVTILENILIKLISASIKDILIVYNSEYPLFDILINKYNLKFINDFNYQLLDLKYAFKLIENYIKDTYIIYSNTYFNSNVFYNSYNESVLLNERLLFIKDNDKELIDHIIDSNYSSIKEVLNVNRLACDDIIYVNNFSMLCNLNVKDDLLYSKPIVKIMELFNVGIDKIKNVKAFSKGMTNRSFLFEIDKTYMFRVPGEGSENLVSRYNEYQTYQCIKDHDICENPIYINYIDGYKITRFIENSKGCDPLDINDLILVVSKIKKLHSLKVNIDYKFNLFDKLDDYELLYDISKSELKDYYLIKEKLLTLKSFVEDNIQQECLCHIDCSVDNFLLYEKDNKRAIELIDLEYSSLCDPHIDIAMFSIYSYYNKEQIDQLIDLYFDNNCLDDIRYKIYVYVAVGGLLWASWCEYKRVFGVEYKEYCMTQYRYAFDYYKLVKDYLDAKEK